MPDLLEAPLQDLRKDLTRLSALLRLVKSVREFAALELPSTNGDLEFGSASRALRDDVRSLASDIPVVSGTLLLYLAGRFEHFVRTSFQALCEEYATKCQTFEQLPPKMRDSLRYYTAEVNLNPRKYGFDDVQAVGFLLALAENVGATTGLGSINSSCLSVTQSNMNPSMLTDLYKRIGVANLWLDIGKQAALKVHLAVQADTDADREARARLEELMALRNQIAHPSGEVSFPDPDQVTAYVAFVDVVAGVLTDVSRVHLAAFKT